MKQREERSAGGIVYKIYKDSNGIEYKLWLITQHSQHKGWSFPKGLIADTHTSESVEEAALREVREEGGIEAKIVHRNSVQTHYTYQFEGELVNKTVTYFLMQYVSGDPQDHDWEVSEAKFVSEDEVKKTLTYKGDKDAFEQILSL